MTVSIPSHLRRLAHAVDDAVYLDEDAYNQVQPKVAYLKTIQVRSQMLEVATSSLLQTRRSYLKWNMRLACRCQRTDKELEPADRVSTVKCVARMHRRSRHESRR